MNHRRSSIPPVAPQRQTTGDLLFDCLMLGFCALLVVMGFLFFLHPVISAILERVFPHA